MGVVGLADECYERRMVDRKDLAAKRPVPSGNTHLVPRLAASKPGHDTDRSTERQGRVLLVQNALGEGIAPSIVVPPDVPHFSEAL